MSLGAAADTVLGFLLWAVFYCEALLGVFIASGCAVTLCVALRLACEIVQQRRERAAALLSTTPRALLWC